MADILRLPSAWRQYLMPASFGPARFYVDTNVRESARRIVQHEFPKRDVPYAEDMGRRARMLNVRGYCIVYPRDTDDPLKKKNYIPARDLLIATLETEGPAILQLPLLGALNVSCPSYRITEEDKLGGYCVFDMTFAEYGQAPATGTRQSAPGVYYAANSLAAVAQATVATGITKAGSGAFTPNRVDA